MGERSDVFQKWMLEVLDGQLTPEQAMKECPVPFRIEMGEIKKLWEHEPSSRSWSAYGLPCMVRRGGLGVWCGYVGVKSEHPYYGRKCNDIDIDVHGGLTFGEYGDGGEWPADYYWLGFDCGHFLDILPGLESIWTEHPELWEIDNETITKYFPEAQYRDFSYVVAETNALAECLSAIQKGGGTSDV